MVSVPVARLGVRRGPSNQSMLRGGAELADGTLERGAQDLGGDVVLLGDGEERARATAAGVDT